MPLLNRKEVPPGPQVPPPGAKEVFIIRCTGECIEKYEDYLSKMGQYVIPQWQDKYFNTSGHTYEGALAIERNVEDQIRKQFPKELEGQVLRQIHHSTSRKDELINRVYESLRPASPGADKENGQQDSPVPSSSQQAPPVTKKLLTQFLIYVADKQKPGVWVCKEQWVQQYGLATELPESMQLAQKEPTSPTPSTSKASSVVAGDATPLKTPLRNKAKAPDGKAGPVLTLEEEEAKLKPGSIKAYAFQVMKARGASQPVSADDIIRITTTDGTCIDWPDKRKRSLSAVLQSESAFVRVGRGLYTLRALAGDMPALPPLSFGQAASGGSKSAGAKSGGARSGGAKGAMAAAFGGASGGSADAAATPNAPKDSAAEGDDQVSGLARAEKLLAQAQKAVAARQADANAANQAVKACETRVAEAKQAKAAKRDSDANETAANGDTKPAVDLDAMFALPEHLKEYKGAEDDRKAKTAWRHERSNEEKRLKKERDAYVQQQRLEAAKRANSDVQALQAALDRAKKSAEDAAAKLERAQKAEADAKRAVEREKQREMLKDIKEKTKAEKEKQKQAEKEERERRRQEALAAKRYPIDDLELLAEELKAAAAGASRATSLTPDAAAAGPSAVAVADTKTASELLPPELLDVPHLSDAKHLSTEQSAELGQQLYVADTLGQFSRQLGVKGCSQAELQSHLEAAVAAGAAGAADEKQREALKWLGNTYLQLLKVLVEDVVQLDGAARIFSRWSEVLDCGAAAWPDLTRRWVMVQQEDGLASPQAVEAAKFLRDHEASQLTVQQHLALLTQLLDDCLDTSLIRDMLSHRIEEAQERAAAVRAELQEGRKKLRELVDAEKESRKRKRAAALALATAAAERQLKEKGLLPAGGDAAGAAAAGGSAAAADAEGAPAAAGDAAAGSSAEDQVAKKIKDTTKEILQRVAGPGISGVTLAELQAELATDIEEEPVWELPPELQEYSGPPGDKKAMSEFRRKQQEARKQLEKQQARWQADKNKRDKAKAEAKKKEVEAERKLQQERQRAEEALAEQQELLEQQLEKFLVRRQPLGNDRYNRVYWWGLAGNKEGLLLQQEVGCAETTLSLLQEAAALKAAAAVKSEAEAEQDGQLPGAGAEQQGGGSNNRRASISEEGIDKELVAPLNHKGLLLPAGREGWAVIEDLSLLEGLANGLEQRGIREKELKAALEKMLPTMSAAISRAAAAKAAAAAATDNSSKKDKSKKNKETAVIPRALPSRHARSAAAEQIRKTGTAAAGKDKEESVPAVTVVDDDSETGPLTGWPRAAYKSAIINLQQLSVQAAAAKAEVPASGDTWARYRAHLEGLVQGDIPKEWAEEAAAAAAALVTGTAVVDAAAAGADVADAKDPAWARAVMAAAAAAAAAADAPGDHQAAATAVLAQLRLQLLGFEQQLMVISGECPYLYRNAAFAGADAEEGAGEQADSGSSEGEVEELQHSEQQQLGEREPNSKSRGRGRQLQQEEEDAVEVDAKARPTQAGAAASQKGGVKGVGRKRTAAAAASSDSQHVEADAATANKDEAETAAPAAKRRKSAAVVAAGLPPRPRSSTRGKEAAAAAADKEDDEDADGVHRHSPGSREGSVAPACSGAAAAAAGKGKKRGRGAAAGASRAASEEPEQLANTADQEEHQQKRMVKKQAARGRSAAGRGGKAAAAVAESSERDARAAADPDSKALGEEDGDCMEVEEQNEGRHRHSLVNRHSHEHQDGEEESEEVAEEDDSTIPFRLSGRTVWRSGSERDSWRSNVAAASTAACLAYCAAALVFHAEQPLQKLAAAAAKKGKKASKK